MDILFGTKRLSVRRFRSADGDDLAEILTDKEVTYFEPYDTFTHEAAVAEAAKFSESSEFSLSRSRTKLLVKYIFPRESMALTR